MRVEHLLQLGDERVRRQLRRGAKRLSGLRVCRIEVEPVEEIHDFLARSTLRAAPTSVRRATRAVDHLRVEWTADRRQRWTLDVDEPAGPDDKRRQARPCTAHRPHRPHGPTGSPSETPSLPSHRKPPVAWPPLTSTCGCSASRLRRRKGSAGWAWPDDGTFRALGRAHHRPSPTGYVQASVKPESGCRLSHLRVLRGRSGSTPAANGRGAGTRCGRARRPIGVL